MLRAVSTKRGDRSRSRKRAASPLVDGSRRPNQRNTNEKKVKNIPSASENCWKVPAGLDPRPQWNVRHRACAALSTISLNTAMALPRRAATPVDQASSVHLSLLRTATNGSGSQYQHLEDRDVYSLPRNFKPETGVSPVGIAGWTHAMAVAMEMSQPTYSLQPPPPSEQDFNQMNADADDGYPYPTSSAVTPDQTFLSVPRRYPDGMQNDTPSLPRRFTNASHGAYKVGRRLGDGTLAVVREAVNVITDRIHCLSIVV
jgi:hypothetical protein